MSADVVFDSEFVPTLDPYHKILGMISKVSKASQSKQKLQNNYLERNNFEIALSDHTILMIFFAKSVFICFLIFKNPKIFKIGPKMSDRHYVTYVYKYWERSGLCKGPHIQKILRCTEKKINVYN